MEVHIHDTIPSHMVVVMRNPGEVGVGRGVGGGWGERVGGRWGWWHHDICLGPWAHELMGPWVANILGAHGMPHG